MAYYDNKPSKFEANGNGSYTYRWNISEVQVSEGETKWECDEVIVWSPVSSNKIVGAVINSLWNKDYEQKLINDYNSAKEGIFDEQKSIESTERYLQFLADRKAIKEQIDQDCTELGIL
jgi:hypothetical protein